MREKTKESVLFEFEELDEKYPISYGQIEECYGLLEDLEAYEEQLQEYFDRTGNGQYLDPRLN